MKNYLFNSSLSFIVVFNAFIYFIQNIILKKVLSNT